MTKKVTAIVKSQIPVGKAIPAPPVGIAPRPYGVNVMQFTEEFNAKAQDQQGLIIPVALIVYQDRSFTFITKTSPAAVLIKKALKLNKAPGKSNKTKVRKLTKTQVREIAEPKIPDLNAVNLKSVISMVAGTARSMGIEVE